MTRGIVAGIVAEVENLRAAIRRHRDYRGDDRCCGDDHELYCALPEGDTRPERETLVTIENCQHFIECRQTGREYVSPQRRIEELEKENARLTVQVELGMQVMSDSANRETEMEAEVKRLQDQVQGHCQRIAKQSELLSKKAERKWLPAPDADGFWRIIMPNGDHEVAEVQTYSPPGTPTYYRTGSDIDEYIDPSSDYFPRHWSKIDFDDAPKIGL